MKKVFLIIGLFLAVSTVKAQHHSSNEPITVSNKMLKNPKYIALEKGMRDLWYAHMYWTLITVDAYYNDPKGLNAKLNRLLQNQKDIGNAVGSFYGQEAGNQLAQLLTEHIQGAVPVLEAAKGTDKASLDKAVADWYANAKEIGEFLHNANPKYWTAEATGGALEMHITHTIAYSVSILKGDYTQSFGGFEEALQHMVHLADYLTAGIVKQFPNKFK